MTVQVLCEGPAWRHETVGALSVHACGNADTVRRIAAAGARDFTVESVAAAAQREPGLFAVVLESPEGAIAATDHCRSTPVFHAGGRQTIVGSDARSVQRAAGLGAPDPEAVIEAAMSGFVTGPRTLVAGLAQLDPGEVVHFREPETPPARARRFIYDGISAPAGDETEARNALDTVTDRAIDRTITQAAGAPVWVPLSGGLDSRLILAKLHARGCENLQTFSYGPRGNADAVVAKAVAQRLGVPWRFVVTPGAEVRRFFAGETRKRYWAFADGLSATPNNQDLLPLLKLRDAGELSSDAVVVNGQTGDFISGGHIPDALFGTPIAVHDFLDMVLARHHGLWRTLLTDEHRDMARSRVRALVGLDLPDTETLAPETAIAMWERFEYEGRQAKYIVNGQRSYDFLNLRWSLPLWDGEFVRFWRDQPPAFKRGQRLYRDTWQHWDHEGVFSMPTRTVTAWSRPLSAVIVPLSIATRLAVGRARRDRLITYLRYLDRFGTHYQAFGWRRFARNAQVIRNPAALYTLAWLLESGFADALPEDLRTALD